jgi:hypothetical protein
MCEAWRRSSERFFPASIGVLVDNARRRGLEPNRRLINLDHARRNLVEEERFVALGAEPPRSKPLQRPGLRPIAVIARAASRPDGGEPVTDATTKMA